MACIGKDLNRRIEKIYIIEEEGGGGQRGPKSMRHEK